MGDLHDKEQKLIMILRTLKGSGTVEITYKDSLPCLLQPHYPLIRNLNNISNEKLSAIEEEILDTGKKFQYGKIKIQIVDSVPILIIPEESYAQIQI